MTAQPSAERAIVLDATTSPSLSTSQVPIQKSSWWCSAASQAAWAFAAAASPSTTQANAALPIDRSRNATRAILRRKGKYMGYGVLPRAPRETPDPTAVKPP